jgi:hypothetical protein
MGKIPPTSDQTIPRNRHLPPLRVHPQRMNEPLGYRLRQHTVPASGPSPSISRSKADGRVSRESDRARRFCLLESFTRTLGRSIRPKAEPLPPASSISRATDAREVYVGLTRHTHDAHIVVERERVEASCRQRQADHRMTQTTTALRERLFTEGRRYREKANVVDYCADPIVFRRSGRVELPGPESVKSTMERAVLLARGLREALTWLDPSKLVAPFWRWVERERGLARELPSELNAIVNKVRERNDRTRNEKERGATYDR